MHNNRVSALETALKHLLSLWKTFRHHAGIIVIDNLMRHTVLWYDKNHSKGTVLSEDNEYKIHHTIPSEATSKQNEYNELKSQLDSEISENLNMRQQISHLKNTLEETEKANSVLQRNLTVLETEFKTLRKESEVLRKRCRPESDIPSMIFYAQGDSSGAYLRKVAAIKTSEHLYQLQTQPGDTTICSFFPIIQSNIQYHISNRNIMLSACEIVGIDSSPTSIIIEEEGKAILENNRWKVIHKAKIKLI